MEVVLGTMSAFCAIKVSVITIVMCECSLCECGITGWCWLCGGVGVVSEACQDRPCAWSGSSYIPLRLGLSCPEGVA